MIADNILADGKSGAFAVFDGHGGKDVSEYLSNNFAAVRHALSLHTNPQIGND